MAKKDLQIKIMAADWSIRSYPSAKRPWSTETKVKKVKEAGFDGMSAGSDPALAAALKKHGLELVGGVDCPSAEAAEGRLKGFKDAGAIHVNVQMCDHDTPTAEALKVARALMVAGEKLGVKPAVETHRDTCTETPEKALALAEAYEKKYKERLRMNFDHSHPAIIKQLAPKNYWPRLSDRLDLWQMADMVHFRPFTGSHCQVPVTNGRGKLDKDFVTWKEFYLEPALAAWIRGASGSRTLYAVPELGPKGSGYALDCFPDIWEDAIRAKDEIKKVWRKLIRG